MSGLVNVWIVALYSMVVMVIENGVQHVLPPIYGGKSALQRPTKEQLLNDFPALEDIKSVFGEFHITAYSSGDIYWRSSSDINLDQFVCAVAYVKPIAWKELKEKYR